MSFSLLNQAFEMVDVAKLSEHPKNPHRADTKTIEESIETNGFYGSIVVQKSTRYVLVGNHRFRIAVERGAELLPVIWLDVDDEKALKILAVDNRSAALGGEDEEALRALLAELPDLKGSGYDFEDFRALDGVSGAKGEKPLFDQSVQVTPRREYVVILADTLEEWEAVRAALGLGTVRRGGYKPGSDADHTGPARVAKAADFLALIEQARSRSHLREMAAAELDAGYLSPGAVESRSLNENELLPLAK